MRATALPLVLFLASAVAGCASAGAGPHAIAAGQDVTLSPGESVTLPDRGRLAYEGVASDSRCPPRVQCIQAGSAVLRFRYTPAGGTESAVEATTPTPATATIPPWRLTVVDLDFGSPPRARVRVDRAP